MHVAVDFSRLYMRNTLLSFFLVGDLAAWGPPQVLFMMQEAEFGVLVTRQTNKERH